MVIYRLNVAFRKSLSPYIYAYMRAITSSDDRKTYTIMKVKTKSFPTLCFRASYFKHSPSKRLRNMHRISYIHQFLLISYRQTYCFT